MKNVSHLVEVGELFNLARTLGLGFRFRVYHLGARARLPFKCNAAYQLISTCGCAGYWPNMSTGEPINSPSMSYLSSVYFLSYGDVGSSG
jgi:hypothetical protein